MITKNTKVTVFEIVAGDKVAKRVEFIGSTTGGYTMAKTATMNKTRKFDSKEVEGWYYGIGAMVNFCFRVYAEGDEAMIAAAAAKRAQTNATFSAQATGRRVERGTVDTAGSVSKSTYQNCI